MTIHKLDTRRVEKPWGRMELWPGFENPDVNGAPVGEVWFDSADGPQSNLLVKYLFTSQKLSIQVHPDDKAARQRGHACGKDEGWLILDAAPDAVIGIGLVRDMDPAELRTAAMDGSIESMIDWRPVQAGEFIYSPAGTIHAIGPGITMIEVQQKIDLTYRLYDYGRLSLDGKPRELHLDDAISVARRKPFYPASQQEMIDTKRVMLSDGPKFVTEYWQSGTFDVNASPDNPVLVVPVSGHVMINDEKADAGSCWIADEPFVCSAQSEVMLTAERAFTLAGLTNLRHEDRLYARSQRKTAAAG